MGLTRLEASTSALEVLARVIEVQPRPVLLGGSSPVLLAAALALRAPVAGVWLRPGPEYPASLAARDVATLAWITPIAHVVVEAERAPAQLAALGALLTNDEVTFSNEVASLAGAYNRPAPPTALVLWRLEGDTLVGDAGRLRAQAPRLSEAGTLVDYVD